MLRLGTMPADKTRASPGIIERNATSLKQIIEEMLDVSRIVSGRLRLNVAPVDLPAILETTRWPPSRRDLPGTASRHVRQCLHDL